MKVYCLIMIKKCCFKGDNATYDDHEIKKHVYNDVHTELVKEEEVMNTREIADEKEDLLIKVKLMKGKLQCKLCYHYNIRVYNIILNNFVCILLFYNT